MSAVPADRLLQIDTIYLEPAATELARGQQVLARFPDARLVEVGSHWQIPELHGNAGNVADWNRIKRTHLVLGTLKSPRIRPNGRSSDFIAPSQANGCTMSCAYCYVPRRKGYANPITVFANIDQLLRATERHIARQGVKATPNQCDPRDWVYDIGENSDCSVDALISDNVRDYVELFARTDGAKASFATKAVNRELLDWDPRGGTRVRFSLMPRDLSRLLDVRTDPVGERIAAIDDFVAAGYEVHVNLSPVVVHEGWLEAWDELLGELDAGVGAAAKAQLAAEVIFLTHNEQLHEVNLGWHPRAEAVLWTPGTQERKRSQSGGLNVRYRSGWKGARVRELLALIERRTPWLRVRYAF
ncbi:spore photoproduct lyase family protein [Solirubrobacter pauli]|uniref:Spore photoproduct lyase family protein n=1 Tax=Solirubrobacter pauli TaxID=166793 RepID=A0A660LFG0_9ACTN|nr:spore photoproduct lyase family protein [Solirubrobacter pauli]RKQ93848.1 spore photoproduct lyase family protein [Solirubrobacter pauli]